MMYPIQRWKPLVVFFLLFVAIASCKKQRPTESAPPSKETPPPSSSIYEPLLNAPTISYCGTPLISTLKIKDGTDIGTVVVGNDAVYLYLTYNLTGSWYLGGVQSFAGQELMVPRNADGNPAFEQFPASQGLNFCDLRQSFSFRVPLSSLSFDNGQCATNTQYYVAMRAAVKQIGDPTNCDQGADEAAWGAPFLINPGNTNEWATAFYYCKQDCIATPPPPPGPSWCAYSQGYWFNNPDVSWCQSVKYGALEIQQAEGISLWPAQSSWIKRAFFQASALQLSMYCANAGDPIPSSIASEYDTLQVFLSQLSYTDIQNGSFPSGVDTTGVRASSGKIGKWICENHCNSSADTTACSGY